MAPIAGQTVLIIGGSSGMGFAVAKLALAEKANVIIASSSQDKVDGAVKRLKSDSPSGNVSGYTVDLAGEDVEAQLENLFTQATKNGSLDHVVYTAGKGQSPPLADVDLATAISVAQLPIFVPIFLGKIAPKFLSKGHTSSITFTSGAVAEKPVPGYSVLSSFVAGLNTFAKCLAVDLAPLRVNVVAPGATETEMWGPYADFMRDMSSKNSLLGKPAKPEDVAEAFVYLLKNVDATGSIVSTNGGAPLK
jgi:NAD(P)-dependent dehydrogenase (short-subunit alcohol dehydrogenase family)